MLSLGTSDSWKFTRKSYIDSYKFTLNNDFFFSEKCMHNSDSAHGSGPTGASALKRSTAMKLLIWLKMNKMINSQNSKLKYSR